MPQLEPTLEAITARATAQQEKIAPLQAQYDEAATALAAASERQAKAQERLQRCALPRFCVHEISAGFDLARFYLPISEITNLRVNFERRSLLSVCSPCRLPCSPFFAHCRGPLLAHCPRPLVAHASLPPPRCGSLSNELADLEAEVESTRQAVDGRGGELSGTGRLHSIRGAMRRLTLEVPCCRYVRDNHYYCTMYT